MGSSRAYPVYRSSDPLDAYAQAQRLCALLDSRDADAHVSAELRTVADVQLMLKLLSEVSYDPDRALTDPVTGDYLFFTGRTLPVDPVELEPLLPLLLNDEVASGGVEASFVRALGKGPATVGWTGRWPDDPALRSFGSPKYDGVQAVFNSDDSDWERWADTHTVFVHVTKFGDLDRAQWLAAQIGGEVLGEAVTGW
ncbi:hypothetical protein [Streptomyces sp. NBC_01669]|uniref:hypothetical protein n=1 Tax=Streptomyces sp. NBC_01669 TaxID=2975909 RepID=UPI00224F7219|nr:hypothetical protein [Streptomyces sp. NBC_01669]MCX4533510.1 hypothetical protein [Streptomyces sp. NBC_01669]